MSYIKKFFGSPYDSSNIITNEIHSFAKEIFDETIHYARETSSCKKLAVGACYISDYDLVRTLVYTSNRSSNYDCKEHGECYKAKVTGIYESCEETRKYCKAVHAEINMINKLKKMNINPSDGILFITRYPCVNCAKNCAEFGFKHIIYCGKQEISDEVKEIFNKYDIEVEWCPEIDYEY